MLVLTVLSVFFILPSMTLAQTMVDVDLSVRHQTMDGTGGNAYGFITGSSWDPKVIDMIINDIDVTHIRLRSAISWWEPSNDNNDPNDMNWSGFKDYKCSHEDFVLLQKLGQADIECMLGIFDVPDWLVENPGAGQYRIIPEHLYPEFGEMIASYIIYARDNYDANITVLNIQNEPNIGIYNYFSPQELSNVTEVVLGCLDSFGLGDIKVIVGDVNEPGPLVSYCEPSLLNPVVFDRAVAVSYHTWHNMSPTILGAVRDYTQGKGVSSWATEVGTSPLDSSTMDWALGSMRNHYYSYVLADSSMTFQWTLGGAETSIDKYGNPYPIFYALKHYHQHIKPGSVRVEASGGTSSLLTAAFINEEEKSLSIVTINTDSSSQNVSYDLHESGAGYFRKIDVFKTTSSMNYEDTGGITLNSDKTFDYLVEGRSFHTFKLAYNHIPDVCLTKIPSPGGGSGHLDYSFVLEDKDGILDDLETAGVIVLSGGIPVLSIFFNDPNPPPYFKAKVDQTGTRLTMELLEIPGNIDLFLIGGGVDQDGGIDASWTKM